MRRIPLLLLLVSCAVASAQDRQFKSFFMEGKKCHEAGDAQCAIKNFKEAFRLNQKATKFKTEGNFFENYLPRYALALAYEKVDALEARDWADKSKNALEDDVIRKRKNELADYHADLERITKAADAYLAKRNQEYNIVLAEAQSLMQANRFKEASSKYEALVKMDSTRVEGPSGLASINAARNTYLKGIGFEVERAIMKKDWGKAESLLTQMKGVDAGYPLIATLSANLNKEREASELAVAQAKANAEAAKATPAPVPRNDAPKKQPQQPATVKTDPTAAARKQATQLKNTVREALLGSLEQYRKGYADKALEALRDIPEKDGDGFGSYHWLKGVYLLTTYHQTERGDEAMKQEASQAMARVAQLMPSFQPDARLYPDFILDFFKESRP